MKFKTHRSYLGRVIYVDNGKSLGNDYKEAQIRKTALNRYDVQFTNGFDYLGIGKEATTLDEAKMIAVHYLQFKNQ